MHQTFMLKSLVHFLFSNFYLFSKASFIKLSNKSLYEIPECFHNFGYILISVNPGIVFISFKYIFSVFLSIKKSTLANPLQSKALKALIAISFISFSWSFVISALITTLELSFLYFASYE